MTREFEISYRVQPAGLVQTFLLKAGNEQEAKRLADGMGLAVLSVSFVRVVLEEKQVYFRLEEAAEYLRCGVSSIYQLQADGKLPKAKTGSPLFHRNQLDAVAQVGMTKVDFRKAA